MGGAIMGGATERITEVDGSKGTAPPAAGDRNAAREIEGGVSIAPFDYSAENFLAAIKSTSELCGGPSEENIEESERRRFSTMVTFLKEWKQFYYEPKMLNFSYESGSGKVKNVIDSINLLQFSSAIVPKMEQLPNRTGFFSSNDFVLHSGGSVWALDWCPRIHEKPDYNTKCEYLAVAAHSPGSSYHKIGAPLVGRGVIQIWCLLNTDEKEAMSLSRTRVRGRPRKRPLCASNAEEGKNLKRPRGRPRKMLSKGLDNTSGMEISTARPRGRPRKKQNIDSLGMQKLSLKRPRGRPRKKVLTVDDACGKEDSPQSNNDLALSLNDCVSPLSIEFGEVAPALANLSEEGSCVPRCSGRPRKEPTTSVNSSVHVDFESHQGNNDPVLSINECIVPLSSEFGEVAPTSANLNVEESVAPQCRGLPRNKPISANLNVEESVASKCRGRPRKKPIPSLDMSVKCGVEVPQLYNDLSMSLNKSVSPLSIESREITPVSANLSEPLSIDFEEITRLSANLNEEESIAPRKKPILNINHVLGVESAQTNNDSCLNECLLSLSIASEKLAPVSVNLNDEGSVVQRSRGRPRKKPVASINKNVQTSVVGSPQINDDLTVNINECISPLSIESGEVALVSTNLNEAESVVPRRRGRPRKSPIPSLSRSDQISGVESPQSNNDQSFNDGVPLLSIKSKEVAPVSANLNEEGSAVPRCRGRSRKKPIPCVNKDVQLLADESPQANNDQSLHECASPLIIDFGKIAPVSTSLNEEESIVPYCRGRPNKKPSLCGNKSAMTSAVKSKEVNLDLPVSALLNEKKSLSSRCRKRPRKKSDSAVSLSSQTDESYKMENCNGFADKWTAVNSDSTACLHLGRSKENVRLVTGANVSNLILSSVGEQKEMLAAMRPAQDDHSENAKLLSKEVSQKRSLEADVTDVMPKLVLCLAHNGKVAWDVKWRPPDANDSEGKHHMGYLAVLLGNGSLEVWEVPLPIMVKSLYTSCCSEGTDPRFLKLNPVFQCSKVKCGDRQSIPLTVEWSSSASQDLILAGCHDGTVALWKFTPQFPSQDVKPLLCFTADVAPIRAVAWAPEGSDAESANLVATAGHEGLKFWDLRDPYHPLWHLNPQHAILSLDWLKDPGCVILSLDDGSVRTLSMWQSACSAPFSTEPISGGKKLGLRSMCGLPFTIWSVHVSRTTGMAAYCSADGSATRFQLTPKSVDKPRKRKEVPHILCGSITEEGQTLKIRVLLDNDSYATNELEETSKSIAADETQVDPLPNNEYHCEKKPPVDVFPPKIVALHRVRWNMNKGSERWLCYGGAAGIVRCQKIVC